jgi:geranylgeranyl diphosphate synthase type II
MHSFPELVKRFELHLRDSGVFSRQPDNLYEPCRYLLALGGKRVRPVLTLLAAELFGEIPESAWHAATGIELFHNFTLIHDDIMDKAPLRRGQPTIHARNGLTAGILCGDVMCIEAYSQFARVSATQLQAVLQIFNQTAIEVCEGQQLDMDYEQRSDVSVDEYIGMIALKTSVLLAAALKIGAVLGGATGGAGDKLYRFGKSLGIAFQLRDDYLDAFGDPARIGKQAGGDILSDKKTYLHLKAIERLEEADRKKLMELQGTETDDKIAQTLALFRKAGADNQCLEAITRYSEEAFAALEDIPVLEKRKTALRSLASQLLERES